MKLTSEFYIKNFLIQHFDEVPSTNDLAKDLIKNKQIFANHIILADQQNKGRGRLDRQWLSPFGNLYFSLVLSRPKISHIQNIHTLSLLTNLSLNQLITNLALTNNFNLNIQNKWPNDLLIEKHKIAGILLENLFINNNDEFIIIGVGVNIDNSPAQTNFLAGNLKQFNIVISPVDFLKNFIDHFENNWLIWQQFGFKNFRQLWLNNAYKLNDFIEIKIDDKIISGKFIDLDDCGNLILLDSSQQKIEICFGDVS